VPVVVGLDTVPVSVEVGLVTVPLRLVVPEPPPVSVPETVDCAKAVDAKARNAMPVNIARVFIVLVFRGNVRSLLTWPLRWPLTGRSVQ